MDFSGYPDAGGLIVSRSVLDIDALVQRVGPLDGQARASVAGGAGDTVLGAWFRRLQPSDHVVITSMTIRPGWRDGRRLHDVGAGGWWIKLQT